MTDEEKINPPQKRPIVLLPWLVILGALLLYGFTLNHWVTFGSLPLMSRITGWDWHPFPLPWRVSPVAPLFLVLTCPVRLLPVAAQPVALNIFAAVCAALTLGLLAASVRLLPHNRTREQRQREGGEFALLSIPAAFLPMLFAVLIMGFHLTFWRDAIAATGEMLDVLVFAFLIYCLLKFRISQNDNLLAGFAFVYGLGTANNWALIGFFPFFFFALVWIKGVNFFNWRFLAFMAGRGILGLLLYLLVPAIASLGSDRANFFSVLHMELGAQSFALRLIPRWVAAVAALPTLLPLVFAGINWPSFEGELSAAGNALTKFMFRLLHVVFLVLALIMFFPFKFSPSLRLQDSPVGFLTFYYMGALCIGYYSGYILLVFGKSVPQGWERQGPLTTAFNLLIVASLWLAAVAAPCWLLYQNFSRIKASRSDALADFSSEIMRDLPAKTAIILADDPVRLDLLEAAFRRAGKPNNHILIETASMPYREYIGYLVSRYPELKKVTNPPEKLRRVLPPDSLRSFLYMLSKDYSVYYLNPSFGYYFEAFYLRPHGLIYELKVYPRDALQAPVATDPDIKANQEIWERIKRKSLTAFPSLARQDPDAEKICVNYSVALDCWGVALQKAGHVQEAGTQFAEAVRINSDNFIARINKEYNEQLQKNNHKAIDSGDLIYKAVRRYGTLVPILKFNGPVDEPDMNLEVGRLMADGHDLRQAAGLFERRLQLLPGDVSAQLDLAKTLVDLGAPDKAIDLARKLQANPSANKWDVARVEALAYYAKDDFPAAEKLMQNALKEDPRDENRVGILADFYRVTAYTALKEMNASTNAAVRAKYASEAGRRFTNALSYIDQQTQLLTLASHNAANPYGVSETLLKKAEVEMMLKSFKAAIDTLTKIIELQPANATALLNRAVAEIQLRQYQAAKDDLKSLRKLVPNQRYMADYGLADVAAREGNTAEEIRCLKRYLDVAPDDLPDYQRIKQRLRKLESH